MDIPNVYIWGGYPKTSEANTKDSKNLQLVSDQQPQDLQPCVESLPKHASSGKVRKSAANAIGISRKMQ